MAILAHATARAAKRTHHHVSSVFVRPPAQGGIQRLGVAVLRLPRRADPIEHRIVTSWNGKEKIQHHSFYNELRVTPEVHPVLPTEGLLNPEANRERMTQTKFETSNVPATYVATQAACVYSFTAAAEREIAWDVKENLTFIGLDHDTEHKSTAELDQEKTYVFPDENIVTVSPNVSVSRKCCSSHTVPIYESYTLHHAIFCVAGRGLTECFMKKLRYSGVDYDTELKSTAETDMEKTFVLPDRNVILSVPNVSIASICCSSQVSSAKKPRHFFPVQNEVRR